MNDQRNPKLLPRLAAGIPPAPRTRLAAMVLATLTATATALPSQAAELPAPALASPTGVVWVIGDGDGTTPDDLRFSLSIAAGESLLDVALREVSGGQLTQQNLSSHFTAQYGAGLLELRLTPATDFDQIGAGSGVLQIRLQTAQGGIRQVYLPLAILPASSIRNSQTLPYALPEEAAPLWLTLPGSGNSQPSTLTRLDTGAVLPHSAQTLEDGSLLLTTQTAPPFPGDAPLALQLTRTMTPSGRQVTQSLTLEPQTLARYRGELDTPVTDLAAPVLTLAGATNLFLTDIRSEAGSSLLNRFSLARQRNGDYQLQVLAGQTLAELGSTGYRLTVTRQLASGGVLTQTLRLHAAASVEDRASGQTESASPPSAGTPAPAAGTPRAGVVTPPTAMPGAENSPAGKATASLAPDNAESTGIPPHDRAARAARVGVGPLTQYEYDPLGRLTRVTDPLNRVSTRLYDSLGRPSQDTDPTGGTVAYRYNGQDQLTQVTDPRQLTTTYTLDGLGQLQQQQSPDTGFTQKTWDRAGNLSSQTDAKGQTTHFHYDAANRLTRIDDADGSHTDQFYDEGPNGPGHLTRIEERATDGSLLRATLYTYDGQGRILTDTRQVAARSTTVQYQYTNGRLTTMTYPSGRQLVYTRDTRDPAGSVLSITLKENGVNTSLVSSASYRPFDGRLVSYYNGQYQYMTRSFDNYGRITGYTLSGRKPVLTWDDASRITLTSDSTGSTRYTYDDLDRLTGATQYTASGTATKVLGYTYDANGNRLTRSSDGTTESYTLAGDSNRLLAVGTLAYTYDANGSLTQKGNGTYTYDVRGRLAQAVLGSQPVSFELNAAGQRVRKQAGSLERYYTYDLQGRLIAEYRPDGVPAQWQEYVWLGSTPVALVRQGPAATTVFAIQSDHLDTPRTLTNSAGKVVWRNDPGQEPFGDGGIVDTPPGQTQAFEFNLRFPGQYFDPETGLAYNYFRDYDAPTGRYVESDPIGLLGGINTYAYVDGKPMNRIDFLGLRATWSGGFHDDDVPVEERDCYNRCVEKFEDFIPVVGIWAGFTSGAAAGLVLGAPALGIGAVTGAFVGGAVGAVGGVYGGYTAASYTDIKCKAQCHKNAGCLQ